MRPAASPFHTLSLFLAVALGPACRAHRMLEIKSDPPGARVVLDQDVIGTTPVEVEFWHYGVRRVTVALPGYRTQSQQISIRPPWYARFPIDIVSEVLLPIGWRDHYLLQVVLEPGLDEITTPDIRSVLDRAEVLRRAGPEGPRALPPARVTLGRDTSETAGEPP